MKNIIKILSLFAIVFTMFNCEEESNFKKSDITLVPVYSLTEISNNGPFQINVYRDQPLVIEYSSAVTASNYSSSGYSDTSTDTEYIFSWSVTKQRTVDDNGVDKVEDYTSAYTVNASKTDGFGNVDIINTFQDATSTSSSHDVTVLEEEVYN